MLTCKRILAKYAVIAELRSLYPTPALCKVLQVSLSGYYRWRTGPISAWQREEDRLEVEIKAAQKDSQKNWIEMQANEKLQSNHKFSPSIRCCSQPAPTEFSCIRTVSGLVE